MLQICKNQRNQGEGKLLFLGTVHPQHICFPPDLSFSLLSLFSDTPPFRSKKPQKLDTQLHTVLKFINDPS